MTTPPLDLRRQLHKQVLKANAARVIDVFRSWDEDGDGRINLIEFSRLVRDLKARR